MNIRWSPSQNRFEAEFYDFGGDQPAVKDAGFKTDGPPDWVWWTNKIPVINKLRENKPPSGLSITPEAMEVYKRFNALHEENEAVKKQLKAARKEADKTLKTKTNWIPEGKIWLSAEDLPPFVSTSEHIFVRPEPPPTRCAACLEPTYEILEKPDLCIWCEKNDDQVFA